MGFSEEQARYETQLGRAHKSLYWAMVRAGDAGQEGAEEDLASLLRELTRIGGEALNPRPKRSTVLEGQTTLTDLM